MTCHDSMLRGNVAHLVSACLGKALQKGGYLYRHPSEVSRCTSSAGVREGGGVINRRTSTARGVKTTDC